MCKYSKSYNCFEGADMTNQSLHGIEFGEEEDVNCYNTMAAQRVKWKTYRSDARPRTPTIRASLPSPLTPTSMPQPLLS